MNTELENMFPNAAIIDDDLFAFDVGDVQLEPGQLETLEPMEDFAGINQAKQALTKLSCTMAGCVNQIHRLWRLNPTNEHLIDVVNYAIKNKGYKPTGGRESRLGANTVREKWNLDQKDKNVTLITGVLFDDLFREALEKNYLIGVTYRGNSDYNKDFASDGILEGSTFKPSTYGHRTNRAKSAGIYLKDGKVRAYDNYKGGLKYNEYDIKQFKELVKNGCYWSTYYLFIKTSNIEKSPEQIKKEKMSKKALELVLYALSSTYDDVADKDLQIEFAVLATKIREKAGLPIDTGDRSKKVLQSVVNALSYGWNYAKDKTQNQRDIAELARKLREEYGLK